MVTLEGWSTTSRCYASQVGRDLLPAAIERHDGRVLGMVTDSPTLASSFIHVAANALTRMRRLYCQCVLQELALLYSSG